VCSLKTGVVVLVSLETNSVSLETQSVITLVVTDPLQVIFATPIAVKHGYVHHPVNRNGSTSPIHYIIGKASPTLEHGKAVQPEQRSLGQRDQRTMKRCRCQHRPPPSPQWCTFLCLPPLRCLPFPVAPFFVDW